MKKLIIVAMGAFFCIAAPTFAQSYSNNDAMDVKSDVSAEHKDNTALSHDHANLKANRAAKAAHKANGDSASQAVDSVKIGANKAAMSEKSTEKNVDQQVTDHDTQK